MRVAALFAAFMATATGAGAMDRSASAERFCHTGPAGCFEGYDAYFAGPTTRYGHDVLGGTPEWTILVVSQPKGPGFAIELPQNVYEDIAPRLADMDGDGVPEVITVESHPQKGARLNVLFGVNTLVSTPHIGTRNRWLAPAGIADFDGDGTMDIAYVDRPHLAKTLRVWSYADGALTETRTVKGVSNHRIGEAFITSATRICDGQLPELLLQSADYQSVIGLRFGPEMGVADYGAFQNNAGLTALAETC